MGRGGWIRGDPLQGEESGCSIIGVVTHGVRDRKG